MFPLRRTAAAAAAAALARCCAHPLHHSIGASSPAYAVLRRFGVGDEGGGGGAGWVPGWVKSQLPSALGGTKDIQDLTMDGKSDETTDDPPPITALLTAALLTAAPQIPSPAAFASSLKQARRLGGLTGFVHGTGAAQDANAQGTLRLFETIVGAMRAEEKADLATFGPAERQRVAGEVGCSPAQVDDCVARFLWMRAMTARMAALKRDGKPMPTTIAEVERELGTWRDYKTAAGEAGGAGEAGVVPEAQAGPGGKACPLAGHPAGKNTKCPLTKKAFKACCGRRAGKGG